MGTEASITLEQEQQQEQEQDASGGDIDANQSLVWEFVLSPDDIGMVHGGGPPVLMSWICRC